jgi:hypothetical protein
MTNIKQAATELQKHFGRPPWLSSIGVGSEDGHPAIIVFVVSFPKVGNPIPEEWEGFPVVTRLFGSFASLGSW